MRIPKIVGKLLGKAVKFLGRTVQDEIKKEIEKRAAGEPEKPYQFPR